jgi:putative ABC transport system permease protein
MRRFLFRLWSLVRWDRTERDLARELSAHVALLEDEYHRRGLTATDARTAARRAVGGIEQAKELHRDARSFRWIDDAVRDARYALRTLARNRSFAVVAVLTLGLGIGANAAIFSLIDAVLLRSLPVPESGRLLQLTMVLKSGEVWESFSYPLVLGLADRRDIFSALCGFSGATLDVGPPESVERTSGAWVTGGCYGTLGLSPAAGRLLTPEDDSPGAVPVAVISDGYWRRRFGADPQVIGQLLSIAGTPVAIAGVSPPGFSGANVGDTADITLAIAVLPQIYPARAGDVKASSTWLRVLARARSGVSLSQARARLAVAWPQIADAAIPDGSVMVAARRRALTSTVDVIPGSTGWSPLRKQFREPLFVLMAVVGVVLVIACVNVATLLLARAAARSREIAVRLAIGAGRGRIVRQLLMESALLAFFGAAVGLGLAQVASHSLVTLLSTGRGSPLVLDLAPNARVLAFTSVVAMATSLLFGIVPAFRFRSVAPAETLGANSNRITGPRRRLGNALVVAQVSLALVLLVGAGLFVRTVENLRRVDRGFRHEGVLLVDVDGPRAGYKGARLVAFNNELLERVRRLPGVAAASFSSVTPLSGGAITHAIAIDGHPIGREEIYFNNVAPRFFETMNTPIVQGREITDRDAAGAPGVAIVNEAFVRRYLANDAAIGRHFSQVSDAGFDFEIVGVVKDAAYETLRELPKPTIYASYLQRGGGPATFEIYTAGAVDQVASAIRAELQPSLPGTPVQVRTLTAQLERSLVQERLMAVLAGAFGVLSLVIAAIGLYGLLAYTVAQRTAEIGIRMALGAPHGQVIRIVLSQSLALIGIGGVMGILAAAAITRYLAGMLFGLTPLDPPTFVAAALTLAVVALLASYVPARRAANVDPLVALRRD